MPVQSPSESERAQTAQTDRAIRSESAIKILMSLKEEELRFSQLYIKTRLKPLIIHRQIENLKKLELIGKNNEYFYITSKGKNLLDELDELLALRFK
ncbi:hypothetical protein DRP05_02430 [Archaeoglobales archaeon]|nr:MAG: hypothetical protein DRP05_02430 [Archaeoglobales archaeon]